MARDIAEMIGRDASAREAASRYSATPVSAEVTRSRPGGTLSWPPVVVIRRYAGENVMRLAILIVVIVIGAILTARFASPCRREHRQRRRRRRSLRSL